MYSGEVIRVVAVQLQPEEVGKAAILPYEVVSMS